MNRNDGGTHIKKLPGSTSVKGSTLMFFWIFNWSCTQSGWQQCFTADDIIHNHHFDRNPVPSQIQFREVDWRGWGSEIHTLASPQYNTRSVLHRLFKCLLQISYTLKKPLAEQIFVSVCLLRCLREILPLCKTLFLHLCFYACILGLACTLNPFSEPVEMWWDHLLPWKGTFISFMLFSTNGLCLDNYSSKRKKIDLSLPIVELPWR